MLINIFKTVLKDENEADKMLMVEDYPQVWYTDKKSSFLSYSKRALYRDGNKIIKFANEEGLTAHANSVKVRLDNEEN